MKRFLPSSLRRFLAVGVLGLAPLSFLFAGDKAAVPAGGTVNLNVTTAPAASSAPPVSITLLERHAHVTPHEGKCTHTAGGLIDVATPTPDIVIVTMTGVVVANSEMRFDLEQCFEVSIDDPKVKKAKLIVEGRVLGLLRGETKGCASYADACVHVNAGPAHLISVCVPPHSVCGCDSVAVNDHDGPKSVPVTPGKYTLHQTFLIEAHSDCWLFKRPSADFAPEGCSTRCGSTTGSPSTASARKTTASRQRSRLPPTTTGRTATASKGRRIPAAPVRMECERRAMNDPLLDNQRFSISSCNLHCRHCNMQKTALLRGCSFTRLFFPRLCQIRSCVKSLQLRHTDC